MTPRQLLFSPRGHISRKTYRRWGWTLCFLTTLSVLGLYMLLDARHDLVQREDPLTGVAWLAFLPYAVTIVPQYMLAIKRCHDMGLSGWWAILLIFKWTALPFVVALGLQKGMPAENKYGLPAA